MDLGIRGTEDRKIEEVWNIQYELLKGIKMAEGEYLGLTEIEVRNEKKRLQEEGTISENIKLKDGEEEYKIGKWLKYQKNILNKYRGKSKEEIEQDKTIEPEEKRRVLALLNLGIKPSIERELTPEETWNLQFNLLKGLKEAEGEYSGLTEGEVKEEQKKLQEEGSAKWNLILKAGEKEYNIGRWLNKQKQMLNKYRGKTKEEIEQDKTIEPEEKRRVIELLDLGISYTDERKPEETWNIQYKLLKELKEAKGEYLGLTEKKVRKEQKRLREKGNIASKLVLTYEGEEYNIGTWLNSQRQMLNKYRGKTKEEIEQDETIEPKEKRKVIELLDFGIKTTIERKIPLEEAWNLQYNFVEGLKEAEGEYLGLTEEKVRKEQKRLREKGRISSKLVLKYEERKYNIGNWVNTQIQMLNKYRGKTKEEIEQDKTIEPEEKRRLIALLELGIKPRKELAPNDIGKAGFGKSEEEYKKAEEDLAYRVEQLEKSKGDITKDG